MADPALPARRRSRRGPGSWIAQLVLVVLAALWLIPLLWTVYQSLRTKADTQRFGPISLRGTFGVQNYVTAWNEGLFGAHLVSSLIITVPAVLLTLALASMAAFVFARFSWKLNATLLIAFTAGNLLPAQVVAAPVFFMFKNVSLPYWLSDSGSLLNSYGAVILTESAFQVGFATFVLANFMRVLPHELTEAALLDGASVWRQYWSITLPLARPALAAIGTLITVWIYNGFFWPLLLIQSPNRMPVTSAVNALYGQFAYDEHLVSAGAIITLIPALVIYLILQRQFLAGLTLGSTKG